MKFRVTAIVMVLMLILAGSAWAGWVIQETMDGGETTLYFHNNQMKVEADGMVQLFNLKTQKLAMINPAVKCYWQGEVSEIKNSIQSAMEESLKALPKEQREAARKMMQANNPSVGENQNIQVHDTGKTETIAGYKAQKYEVMVNGELKEELWLAPKLNLSGEIDFEKLGNMMEAFSMDNMEDAYEFDPKVMALYKKGYPVKRVTHQGEGPMVELVVKAVKKSLSDSQFKPSIRV